MYAVYNYSWQLLQLKQIKAYQSESQLRIKDGKQVLETDQWHKFEEYQ